MKKFEWKTGYSVQFNVHLDNSRNFNISGNRFLRSRLFGG